MTSHSTQSGSVLIYILLAIVVIAGMSAAILRDNRPNQSILSAEQAKIAAQEIIDYGSAVANAVQKLRLKGCTENQVSFQNPVTGYANPSAPSDESCHVFSLKGGSLTYRTINAHALDVQYEATTGYGDVTFNSGLPVEGVGSTATELLFQVNYLKPEVCMKINDLLAVRNPNGAAPVESNQSGAIMFAGVYGPTVADNIGNDGGHDLPGKTAFCRAGNPNVPQYNQVLIVR